MRPIYLYLLIGSFSLLSCVSSGKFKAMQQEAEKNDSLYNWSLHTLKTCQDDNTDLKKQASALQTREQSLNLELGASRENNILLRKQLESLSAISNAQAESIKKSLDNMGATDAYLHNLQYAIKRRDSMNMVVVMDLKANMGGFGEKNVAIKLEKGIVYVDLSDSILFNSDSNSYIVSTRAKTVLGRLARVLNDQPDIEIMVEGHTDSISYPQDVLPDNWDLSTKRATSLIRILQNNYKILPSRMTAAGRGEYITISANDTEEGRAANRRTRIVILPQLDQLLRLLDRRQGQEQPTPAAANGSGSTQQ